MRLERITERPLAFWKDDAQRFVREHLLQAIALTVGVGYVLGKLVHRRPESRMT